MLAAGHATGQDAPLRLWYDSPAEEWCEALPIGSGRLGAMVFGGPAAERLQFNEDTLWSGGPHDYNNPEAYKCLAEARKLVFTGKQREAQKLLKNMMGRPARIQAYLPMGNLRMDFDGHDKATGYRRQLDLERGVVTITYQLDGVRFTRRIFASYPDQAIVIHVTCDKPGRISFDLSMATPHRGSKAAARGDTLRLTGKLGKRVSSARGPTGFPSGPWNGEGVAFEARVKVRTTGGTVSAGGGTLRIRGSDEATVIMVAATSFKTYQDITADPAKRTAKYLADIGDKPCARLLGDHIADHSRLLGRVSLDLGKTSAAKRPTDERLKASEPEKDPQLAALMFQFGRYLLIASSRPGCQPANLQGIWNKDLWPAWGGKWTVNINTQMNYWPAEVCNLSECHQPLLEMVKRLGVSGRRTAKAHYGARGWVCHHNTDIWMATAPVDRPYYGMWQTGGAWLCTHLWEHYLFTGDKAFLAKAYPTLKSAAEFFVDVLVEHPTDKHLVTCPLMSPEHRHSKHTTICAGPAIDMQLIGDLFDSCIRTSHILGVDDEFRRKLGEMRPRLAPHRIGKHGQLQEWISDWDDPADGHGHVSHLYALYPGAQITRRTPKLLAAARTSLIHRKRGYGGWPGAWRISLWARLSDGEKAHAIVRGFPSRSMTPNMFNGGRRIFQIDGNFGVAAGIAEMLLQSHDGEIHLLPALPKAWAAGSVTGLCARGGFQVNIQWAGGKLTGAVIRSKIGGECRIRSGEATVDLRTQTGGEYHLDGDLRVRPAKPRS